MPFVHDHCGTCERCIKACPTNCIQPDRTIDARRCISYHTIENRGAIPDEIMPRLGNWVFGCDVCQMVCPWNSKQIAHRSLQNDLLVIDTEHLIHLLTLSEEEFRQRFGNTSLSRTQKRGLLRNVLIRLGNLADKSTTDVLSEFISNATDPILVQTASWALNQMN
jgi:epoxyqueuosine reductase